MIGKEIGLVIVIRRVRPRNAPYIPLNKYGTRRPSSGTQHLESESKVFSFHASFVLALDSSGGAHERRMTYCTACVHKYTYYSYNTECP